MLSRRLSCISLFGSLAFVGCQQTPTGPSTVVPNVVAPPPATASETSPIVITPPAALGATRFMAFGDSITWGAMSAWDANFIFAAANGGYPERLQSGLRVTHSPQQFTVFNEGLPGELVLNAMSRFRMLLTSRRPEVVLLLEGINDISNDYDPVRVATALFQLVDAATTAGMPVVVATMYQTYPVTDPDGHYRSNGAGVLPAFNAEVRRRAAGRLNVHLLDLEPLMRNRSYVGADGIHLTDSGHEILASSFMQRIESAFPVLGSFQ
jgi:lysophospholipase L1-like esterase